LTVSVVFWYENAKLKNMDDGNESKGIAVVRTHASSGIMVDDDRGGGASVLQLQLNCWMWRQYAEFAIGGKNENTFIFSMVVTCYLADNMSMRALEAVDSSCTSAFH
jgi:hypothetical protein